MAPGDSHAVTGPNEIFRINISAPLMEGDTNLNKHVTITDALFIARYKAGLMSLTPDQLKAADTNDDGQVTIPDALFIAKWLANPSFKLWNPVKDADMLQPVLELGYLE
ncbi:MAG TPA: dockerin type I repeat-containing protein [Candidatus Methanoperedens sp.]